MALPLSAMRYTRIDGTAVSVTVTTADEAKSAVKELKHKKRELRFLRSALVRQRRAAEAKQKKRKRRSSLFWKIVGGLRAFVGWLIDLCTVSRAERRARDPAEIEREMARIDETLHNIDGCVLQLEGKLITQG